MRTKLLFIPLLFWLTSFVCAPVALAQSGAVAIVVNEENPVTNLSRIELRRIFAGQKHSWPSGVPIKLFVRAPGAHERTALLKLLAMTESEYKGYWTAQVFRGEAQAEPLALFSNGMQKEAVTAFPGAVVLMDTQDVKPGMKVVKMDGHMPSEAGYPLN
jgi:hypothetical protein